MFAALQTEIMARCHAASTFFAAVSGIPAPALAVAKGLMFVELYGTHEYTVLGIVRAALSAIKTRPTVIGSLKMELLSLALDPELESAGKCLQDNLWKNRMGLFRRVNSPDNVGIADTVFPKDGSHFRVRQLRTIWEIFGITTSIVLESKHLGYIDELVDNRNAIAHGRETAASVGRRYTSGDIADRITGNQQAWLHLVSCMQAHVANPVNLQR